MQIIDLPLDDDDLVWVQSKDLVPGDTIYGQNIGAWIVMYPDEFEIASVSLNGPSVLITVYLDRNSFYPSGRGSFGYCGANRWWLIER